MSDTKIIEIGSRREDETPVLTDETGIPSRSQDKPTRPLGTSRAVETQGANALVMRIDTARLYDAPIGDTSNIVRALELLKELSDHFSAARKAEDSIDADRFLQHAQALLPRLFSLRSIGGGFGLIVNSLYIAFTNLHGIPMTPKQIDAGWRLVRELKTYPAISLERGIDLVEELEESGLEVDPPELAALLEDTEPTEND